MTRLLIATDAWLPQVNGVVRTWQAILKECRMLGHEAVVVSPSAFATIPCPTYPEIRLALAPGRGFARQFDQARPDFLHIVTEGPVGAAARRYALTRRLAFTTGYHTRFPEYVSARLPVPQAWTYRALRRFHRPSRAVLVATPSLRDELAARGFRNLVVWPRGVDTDLFRPGREPALDLPKPVFGYAGRVAVEKNLEAFLALDLPGSKLVVGGGPALAALRRRFPDAVFAGMRHGEDLARHYAAMDVLVFPSRTDTFGLVMLEALACGIPVAAFPVTGPRDVIADPEIGALDPDLARAALSALGKPPKACRAFASGFSWAAAARRMLEALTPIEGGPHGPRIRAAPAPEESDRTPAPPTRCCTMAIGG